MRSLENAAFIAAILFVLGMLLVVSFPYHVLTVELDKAMEMLEAN